MSEVSPSGVITIPFELTSDISDIELIIKVYDANGDVVSQSINTMDIKAIPDQFILSQNYPNPFNPITKIGFGIPESRDVSIVIYDIRGNEVKVIAKSFFEAGFHKITWDGRDNSGKNVSAGMYFYQINAGDCRDVKKLILLK